MSSDAAYRPRATARVGSTSFCHPLPFLGRTHNDNCEQRWVKPGLIQLSGRCPICTALAWALPFGAMAWIVFGLAVLGALS